MTFPLEVEYWPMDTEHPVKHRAVYENETDALAALWVEKHRRFRGDGDVRDTNVAARSWIRQIERAVGDVRPR